MRSHEILTLLGFAAKARKLMRGTDICLKAAKNKKICLIIMDESASENTAKRIKNTCIANDMPMLKVAGLGEAIGNPGTMVAGISDKKMAEALMNKFSKQD